MCFADVIWTAVNNPYSEQTGRDTGTCWTLWHTDCELKTYYIAEETWQTDIISICLTHPYMHLFCWFCRRFSFSSALWALTRSFHFSPFFWDCCTLMDLVSAAHVITPITPPPPSCLSPFFSLSLCVRHSSLPLHHTHSHHASVPLSLPSYGRKKPALYSSYPSPNFSEPEIKLFCNSKPVMRCQRHFTLWWFCSCSDSQPKLLQVCFMRLFTLNAWLASTLKTAKVLSLTVAHPKQCHGWVHREYSFIYCRTVCLTHPSNQIQKGFLSWELCFLERYFFPPKAVF